ncbi:MAG: metallophosphoesterase [Vicinamibacterales bacterium]
MRARAIGFSVAGALAMGLLTASRVTPPLAAAVSPCEIDGVNRIVAIGDVHGAYDRFVEILGRAGLIDARLRWTGGKTHLVQLGDVVDRGPDSLKVLDLLRRLEKDASRAGGAVHALLGNHEVMRMTGDMRYVHPGEYGAFKSSESEEIRQDMIRRAAPNLRDDLLRQTPLGYFEMRLAFGRQGIYGQWLRQHDVMIRINGLVFVHAGIPPALAGLTCDVVNTTIRREITADLEKTLADPLANLSGREDGHLWNRELPEEFESFAPQVNEILAAQNARAIVIAHTVTPDGRIRVRFGGKVLQIDTGMQPAYVEGGRASALEIQNGVLTAIYSDRRDILEAQATAAAPSAGSRR